MELNQFSRQKNIQWAIEKRKADSLALALNIPISYYDDDSNKFVILQRLGPKNIPVYYATDNISAAATISADALWTDNIGYTALSGVGVEINVWDGGAIRASHQELQDGIGSKVEMRDLDLPLSNHSTHIAGTICASGVYEEAKGMAGKANIKAWDLNNDITEMSGAAADGIVLSNHSYGPFCGWSYNSANDNWYWYGDPEISENEDYKFGFYDEVSSELDYIAELAPFYLIVKSAGNDRNDGPVTSFVHYVWDGTWNLVDVVREPDGGAGGFDCLTPMAVAKNILTVGAVDDTETMTTFSSYGPTDDGRIKPDIVANGFEVISSTASSDNAYASYNGTSMSTASVSGSVALLHQLQNTLQPGILLRSSTIKGLLIHTAKDIGNIGPDYSFGWGLVNIKEAADLLYANSHSQGKNIQEYELTNEEEMTIPARTISAPFLKVTICWTDPAAQASSPALNARSSKLINDLNLQVESRNDGQIYMPWVLNVENPGASATRSTNHIDNVEQVYIANPGDNDFNIKISHSGSLSGGSQIFTLIVTGIETISNIFPPQNLSYHIVESTIVLNWNPPVSGAPELYKIYRNGALLATTTNNSYDDHIIVDNGYEYYVSAEYEINSQKYESLGTNRINAYPQTLRSLPFIVDFEQESNEIQYKNSLDGWRWGYSESLSCYYLDFSANATNFIGADSYSAGDATHVSDIAATAPLRLEDYENIVLSFEYMLKTGIYDAIDELHVVYKLQEEQEWLELKKLASSFNWKYDSIELPDEICKNGTQIGFYYDDLYQWGMGAGLDNIKLTGTQVIIDDLALESIDAPESSLCFQSNPLNLSVTIKNTGSTTILSGQSIIITSTCNGIQKIKDFTLTENLSAGSSKVISFSNLIDPLPAGTHNLLVSLSWAKDQNSANNSKTKSITINSLPIITFTDPPDVLCEDTDPVEIAVSPAGGSFDSEYMTGNIFNPELAGVGIHSITYTYTDNYECINTSSISIEIALLPEVSFTGLASEYCVNEESVILAGIPSGGVFDGPGITNNVFSPESAGVGTHSINYTYINENGCSNTVEQQTVVHELTQLSFSNLADSYCQNSDLISLIAIPDGGTFYINDLLSTALDPSQYEPGLVEVSYIYQNPNGCLSTISKNVGILELPEVSVTDPGNPLCLVEQDINLVGQPAGGTFSGDAVIGNTFNPILAGIGDHDIFYTYEDANLCTNSDTLKVQVVDLPAVSFNGLASEYCVNAENVILTGIPSGGIFDGPGITNNVFSPESAEVGLHSINYSYTDVNGCSNTASQKTNILNVDAISFTDLNYSYCQNGFAVELSATPEGGNFMINGVTTDLLDPKIYPVGLVEINYTFLNANGCQSTAARDIDILASPEVNIIGLSELYCPINQDYELTAAPEGGDFLLEGESIDHFNPLELGTGTYEIFYTYSDEAGCSGQTSKAFDVRSNPEIRIDELAPIYCPNGEDVILTGDPAGGYFEGPGIQDNVFSPRNLLPGTYIIDYIYDLNGCLNATSATTTITNPIETSIEGILPEYCPADSLVNISGHPEGGVFNVTPTFDETPGSNTYNLYYSYTDVHNCTFTDSALFRILPQPDYDPPTNLQLMEYDTINLELKDPHLVYYWSNDSTSKILQLIGNEYQSGNNTRTITILDMNGCRNDFQISFYVQILTALSDQAGYDMILFPNPAGNTLNIQFADKNKIAKTEIAALDLNGKQLDLWREVELHKGKAQINVGHLLPGIYLLRISVDNKHFIRKISISR